jgi:hypothetical protein
MMNQLATQTVSSRFNSNFIGGIDYLSLNYNEVKCLEMALYFLSEQLNHPSPHCLFSRLRGYHVRNLNYWLNKPDLRRQLRFDSTNDALWPVVSSEDAEWLALALEVGINEDTIFLMAADDANYERDMAAMHAEEDPNTYMLADLAYISNYVSFYNYYCDIASCRHELLIQLRTILNDD